MKGYSVLILISSMFVGALHSQTLIINEVSNGPSGLQEYVELVVVDASATYDCSGSAPPCVDIRGWIYDDNNGYHGASGIASGCARFTNDPLWSCVPIGTIILLYNGLDPNPNIPPDDISLLDGNCMLSVSLENPQFFEFTETTPGDIVCSYPTIGWGSDPSPDWSNVAMSNGGDCARLVDLNGCEVFSLCYGAANLNTMIYFTGVGNDDMPTRISFETNSGSTSTSEKMRLSQPAVSRLIQLLEQEYSVKLFYRDQKSLVPTPEGEKFYQEAFRVVSAIDRFPEFFSQILSQKDSPLRVICHPRMVNGLVVPAIKSFIKQHPEGAIKLVDHSRRELGRRIVSDEFDIGVFTMPVQIQSVELIEMRASRLQVLVNKKHQLAPFVVLKCFKTTEIFSKIWTLEPQTLQLRSWQFLTYISFFNF